MNKTYVLILHSITARGKLRYDIFEIPHGEEIEIRHEERGGNYQIAGHTQPRYGQLYRPDNRHVSIKGLKRRPGYIYDEWDFVNLVITSDNDGDIDMIELLLPTIEKMIELRIFFEDEVPNCDDCEETHGEPEGTPWEDLD